MLGMVTGVSMIADFLICPMPRARYTAKIAFFDVAAGGVGCIYCIGSDPGTLIG